MLEGLELIGFAIWESRGNGGRSVTFPARQYSVNGERRSVALFRPITDPTAHERIKALILSAYAGFGPAVSDQRRSGTSSDISSPLVIPSPVQISSFRKEYLCVCADPST